MTLIQFLGTFINTCWQFMRLPFPATNIPIGAILIFPTFITVVLNFVRLLFGITKQSSSNEDK